MAVERIGNVGLSSLGVVIRRLISLAQILETVVQGFVVEYVGIKLP